ncbi:hypothetical protein FT663_03900 [Candidozyma haemuli var. vulneris]|uniref:CRAL-TRIO domain-containing protein n=1 Tax=Candidozyma haemuli TaxID=45357 RepID=A0A2V1AQU4_9ASCO|nr:hypothetical protein CXQ85_001639 [[Candida] haemuloni]KAF3987497.1 hypothetical protein FT662_03973 [[Candida] haemuloni var. vulneris]KAF3988795.1 hypothetical protein FT663_03900 [[Candida] haemuloni var. vulneris]PVH19331.1 hypothetical protein CXQ85_001639 [[Candida] haemuloni]
MTKQVVRADRVWSIEGEHEIVFKQVYGICLKSFGYDLDEYTYEQLLDKKNFVAGKALNALPEIQEESVVSQCPPVSERTRKNFKHMMGKSTLSEGSFDSSIKVAQKHVWPKVAKFNLGRLHQAFLITPRNDSPDNDILRFVRARKFKVEETIIMAFKCLDWKSTDFPVEKYTIEGDLGISKDENLKQLSEAFGMGKVYLRGTDREGGPICVIRVRKHFGSQCPHKDFERFIVLMLEWFRLGLKPYTMGSDGANILFDLTGISLKNIDLAAVKFLAKAFEANYPESLTAIWIHNAPWVFFTVWKLIRGWLDPVVASKVHFTNSAEDLEKFVDRKFIPDFVGGDDKYVPEYVPPTDENSSKKPEDDKFEELSEQRKVLSKVFIETTISWIKAATKEESTKFLNLKIQLGAELAKNLVELDPYIRTRGQFDRNNAIDISL